MVIKDICGLELLFNNGIIKRNCKTIKISTKLGKNNLKFDLCEIDIIKNRLKINKEFLKTEEVDERSKMIIKFKSYLINALMRASILKPDLKKHRERISHWDDVILGLDTNIFYNGITTSCLLDSFLKIPSGDFIDSPDWVTLVLSKVAMGEIENMANHSRIPFHRKQALRAIQEIMLINKSKDLEGVSMFLAGNIPPSFSFTHTDKNKSNNTVRDSTIREQFRVFLKNLDFHKGSYFLTEDFNNGVLAEAEGLNALYLKKLC